MKISQLQNLPVSIRSGTTTILVEKLEPGQLLRAVVEALDGQGRATLRVGSALLTADMGFAVRTGDKLTLQVIRSGQTPLLAPVPPPQPALDLHQALRTLLPKQAPLPPLLQRLATVAQRPERTALPTEVVRQVRTLLENLPDAGQIRKPGALKRALRDSGNFLDTRLLNASRGATTRIPSTDFQASLLRLKQALQTAAAHLRAPGKSLPAETTNTARPSSGTPASNTIAQTAIDERIPETGLRLPQTRLAAHAIETGAGERQAGDATRAGMFAAASAMPPGDYLSGSSPARDSSITMLIRHLIPRPQGRANTENLAELRQQELLDRLLQDTAKAIARTRFNQLASRHAESDNRQVWLLELPVRKDDGIDLFQLRIQRDQTDDSKRRRPESRWSVDLAFELEGIGPVHARVCLQDGRIATTLWLGDETGLNLFREHVEELHGRLSEAGLLVGELKLLPGRPAEQDPVADGDDGPLVDFTA